MGVILLLLVSSFANPTEWDYSWDWAIATKVEASVLPQVTPPAARIQKYRTKKIVEYKQEKQRVCTRNWRGQTSCGWKTVTVAVPKEYQVPVEWPDYPLTNKKVYRLNNGRGPKATWEHLANDPHHTGMRFNREWLQSLTDAEIQALHADCHEGTVQTMFIVQ